MILKLVNLNSLKRRVDRSVSMSFVTALEQSAEDMTKLDGMFQQDCIIAIKPESECFSDEETKAIDSIKIDLKESKRSHSQRQRDVLYRLWQQEGVRVSFNDFYDVRMNMIIEQIKDKLN